MTEIDPQTLSAGRVIWNYLKLDMTLRKADGIVIFCSNDLRVAEFAASLYNAGFAKWICPTGGVGRLTYGLFHQPEALAFSEVLMENGVPQNVIFPETKATNSAENTFFTHSLIEDEKLPHSSLIILQKPYMERRTLATLTYYWPEQPVIVASPPISFDRYPFDSFSLKDLLNILAGEIQRMSLYAERGWQSQQPIPQTVISAFKNLLEAGYSGQLADPAAKPSKPG
jgi:uncharacterized SAM-binding protein YcdF (DUF218 family)